MIRSILFFIAFIGATHLCAQSDALSTLTGGNSLQWTVIGSSATAGPCAAGDASYTFQAKPAQVVVTSCVGGAWKPSTEALTTWTSGGKSGIAFGGAKYEVKALPASAPACKGQANCVRLVTVPDGRTDATRTIYLTR